jgi:hypothetical protein
VWENPGTSLPYIPVHQGQRPGLALMNATKYIASGLHSDITPWQGWIVGYDEWREKSRQRWRRRTLPYPPQFDSRSRAVRAR